MKGLALQSFLGKEECDAMISVLKHQKWNDMIPKYLPKDIDIAHKTGAISGVHHDAAIIYLSGGDAYILVLLSKNLKDFETGTEKLAKKEASSNQLKTASLAPRALSSQQSSQCLHFTVVYRQS